MQLLQYLKGAGEYLTTQKPSQSMLLVVMLVGQPCAYAGFTVLHITIY